MRKSKDGTMVGITLRLPVRLLAAYTRVANRANLIELQKGAPGMKTAQDVMRHRLASLPAVKAANTDQEVGK